MVRSGISRISQETLAILGVGIALAALILTTNAWLRDDIRALGDDIRSLRDELRTEIRDVRTTARTDREAWRAESRADRAVFESRMLRLIKQHGGRGARIDPSFNRTSSGVE